MAKLALFFVGAFALALAIGLEAGSGWLLGEFKASDVPAPGIGVRSLLFLDAVLAYVLILIASDFFPPIRSAFARAQGLLTFVLSIGGLLLAVVFIAASINLVTLMLTLLMSPPFGTLAYFAIWGTFDKVPARLVIDLSMFLKVVGVAFVIGSHPSFLKNRSLMLLLALSFGLTFVVGLLHAWPPSFLVAITDGVGAIIAGIVALVWMVALLVGSLPGVIRAVRSVIPV